MRYLSHQAKYMLLGMLFLTFSISAQVTFTDSNLPIVVLETNGQEIPNEPKITATMRVVDNGPGVRNSVNGPFNEYDGFIGIERRGSSSSNFPKKQYALETRLADGSNNNIPLLGMPEENDWVLYAPYSDKSLLRNKLTFDLAREMGRYATRAVLCEVVLNGDYQGVYVMMEKIKRDDNRVDIRRMTPEDNSGDELTGGYIIKIDKTTGVNDEGWTSPFEPYPGASQEIRYQYHIPDEGDITTAQKAYIEDFIFEFEDMMDSPTYDDPFTGYHEVIDIESFVDFFIVNEIGRNVDGYRLSTFLYKDRDSEGGLLNMGPLWDFNLAFGNADYYEGWLTSLWQMNFQVQTDGFQIPFWWEILFADPIFKNALECRWLELREDVLHTDSVFAYIDEQVALLAEAEVRNFQRWPVLGNYVWPNWFIGSTYAEEITFLKDWTEDRFLWMDMTLGNDCSKTTWADPDDLNLISPVGQAITLPVTLFELESENVDALEFVSGNDDLLVTSDGVTVRLEATAEGAFMFKAYGIRDGVDVVLSPAYLLKTDVNATVEEPEEALLPVAIDLAQNYPNPFNGTTVIEYGLQLQSDVRVEIFDTRGVAVYSEDLGTRRQGYHRFVFDGRDAGGNQISSGFYIYRFTVKRPGFQTAEVRKMLYTK